MSVLKIFCTLLQSVIKFPAYFYHDRSCEHNTEIVVITSNNVEVNINF